MADYFLSLSMVLIRHCFGDVLDQFPDSNTYADDNSGYPNEDNQ